MKIYREGNYTLIIIDSTNERVELDLQDTIELFQSLLEIIPDWIKLQVELEDVNIKKSKSRVNNLNLHLENLK